MSSYQATVCKDELKINEKETRKDPTDFFILYGVNTQKISIKHG